MYKIIKYIDKVAEMDADTVKRVEMIRTLSNGFTVEHKIALEMDKLLVEQVELEMSVTKESKESSTTAAAHEKQEPEEDNGEKQSSPSLSELAEEFRSLFESIKAQRPQLVQYVLRDRQLPSAAKPEIESFQQIVDDVILGHNVMLIGGAGTGKTYMAENLVATKALGRAHITINCSQWTAPTEIIGGQTMDGYVEGKLIEAWKKGLILILDELPKIDPNTAGLLNDALAKSKIPNAVIFNARKESFTRHADFACIATGNIYPNKESIAYGANNKQDLSLLDRFSGSVYFIEKNPKIEKAILQNNLIWSLCDCLRSAIEELKYEAQLSLRFMLTARDSYDLEKQRQKDAAGKKGIKPEEGKTLKSAFDCYLSTFTEIQQKNLKEKMRYRELLGQYEYRKWDKDKTIL